MIAINCSKTLNCINLLEYFLLVSPPLNNVPIPRIRTTPTAINKMIDNYVAKSNYKSVCFTSLGQLRYLSAMCHVDAVVGNSSSGLIETPSFRIGTINIGNRQKPMLPIISFKSPFFSFFNST